MDHLTSMTVFANVVSEGSFAGAAKRMRLSPAAVSKHVHLLEEWLGARLLNRTTRRISLTEVGASVYERSLRILEDVEDVRTSAAESHARPTGSLRVSAPISFGALYLGKVVAEYLAAYPEVSVELVLDDRVVDIVEEGLDVAVRIAPLTDSNLIARRIAPSWEVICASPEYIDRRGRPTKPSDLQDHDCLDYALRAGRGKWRFDGPEGEVAVKVSARMTATNGQLLRDAALSGAGIVLGPTFLLGEAVRSGWLEIVMPLFKPVGRSIYAVYPSRRHLSAKVQSFVTLLADRFGENPPWDNWNVASGVDNPD
ncbi:MULTISPECIES: LysR family transcriptional regulator [Mesorhizobium]|uniref:Transcriptional regulator, LysR family n=1 Tax=Mesorhizobium opportunistum (strain LMG 24607 / HAMBI 3007 / WSM2075) TaxID=536019 RepID=F7Y9K7_MESOW|nr:MULTISPECIES: LysR family transcriptional regulator [Mesorhizobium]AEH88733.1 transcriptional regulator, LysR family [Mesorhizobium opportunistum WSM2075]TPN57298.1 LysR family transcriptional regulator [Mesorhizobium sp. B1-1-7]TPN57758.1 LysR family transcriptional regulator [Mesorhizobium sp. B1-1-9]